MPKAEQSEVTIARTDRASISKRFRRITYAARATRERLVRTRAREKYWCDAMRKSRAALEASYAILERPSPKTVAKLPAVGTSANAAPVVATSYPANDTFEMMDLLCDAVELLGLVFDGTEGCANDFVRKCQSILPLGPVRASWRASGHLH
jgi:hypothetical protein